MLTSLEQNGQQPQDQADVDSATSITPGVMAKRSLNLVPIGKGASPSTGAANGHRRSGPSAGTMIRAPASLDKAWPAFDQLGDEVRV
jgi:hypothetical protein